MQDTYGNDIEVRDSISSTGRSITITAPYPMRGLRDWQASDLAAAVREYIGGTAKVVKLGGRWSVVGERQSYPTVEACLSAHYGVRILRVTA